MRIRFLNPFSTDAYDQLIHDTLGPSLRDDVTVDIAHLDGPLENMDYFASKHILEVEIMKAAVAAEQEGFDAFVIGCCYDPGLTQCRELVDIPVVGPLEASVGNVRAFGQRFAVVTDHHKAATEIADRVRLYGQEANCKSVTSVGWFIDDMVKDPAAVAADVYTTSKAVMAQTGAETVIVACTIVAGCYETSAAENPDLRGISVIDPNIVAVKQAEMLADLNNAGKYRIARTGYYQQLAQHSPAQDAELRAFLASRPS
jgi:allantoin racemase